MSVHNILVAFNFQASQKGVCLKFYENFKGRRIYYFIYLRIFIKIKHIIII